MWRASAEFPLGARHGLHMIRGARYIKGSDSASLFTNCSRDRRPGLPVGGVDQPHLESPQLRHVIQPSICTAALV